MYAQKNHLRQLNFFDQIVTFGDLFCIFLLNFSVF